MVTKPRGGSLKALVAGPLRKELFLAASLNIPYLSAAGSWMFLLSLLLERILLY